MPKPPDYGLIYNWDGAPHSFSEYPQSMEAFLDKMYAPMEDTQVGAHFWCVGAHHAAWKSEVLELPGDLSDRRYSHVMGFIEAENMRAMLDRGEDPQKATIIRGRELGMDVYASVRMNDNHFNGAKPQDLSKMHKSQLTKMRLEHPEWLLGNETTEWFAFSWNFSVPEVREHRYKHVEEVCRLYDWDGVELDWQRHAFHLPEDYGYRMRYVLTDLQRAIRQMTNELGRKRGRPHYLAVRVSGTLENCMRIGTDIPTWINEGLVDIIIPSGLSDTDPAIDVKTFVKLCEGTDIAVYPGLDTGERFPGFEADIKQGIQRSYRSGGFDDRKSHEQDSGIGNLFDTFTKDQMINRGMASRFHKDGADGIYLFNWYSDRRTRHELMNQIGKPDTLRKHNKIFAATHRYLGKAGAEATWYGAFHGDRIWGEVPVPLKPTITNDGPTIKIDVADDLTLDHPNQIELRLRIQEWLKGDVIKTFWDDLEQTSPNTAYDVRNDNYANPFSSPVSEVSNSVWISYKLDPAEVSQGLHHIKVVLGVRSPHVDSEVVLTHVEVVVLYN